METSSRVIIENSQNIKIIMIGDLGAGKSSILNQFIKQEFTGVIAPTYGADYHQANMQMKQMRYKLKIFDTAFLEKYNSINQKYYKGADAVFLTISLFQWYEYYKKNEYRFPIERLNYWLSQVSNANQKKQFKIVLAANKIDLLQQFKDSEAFSKELVIALQQFCDKFNTKVVFTSAKTGQNIEYAFRYLVAKVYQSKQKSNFNKTQQVSFVLGQRKKEKGFWKQIWEFIKFW